jgi:PAS domain S-box-containing protein
MKSEVPPQSPEQSGASPKSLRTSFPLIRIGVCSLAYFLAQVLAFQFPDSFGLVASIWPAAGIALASLLLSPRRFWPALLGCLFVSGLAANLTTARPVIVCVGFMVANICETAASAWLIVRLCGDKVSFTKIRDVLTLTAAASLINAVTALIGAGVASLVINLQFGSFYQTWWIADGLGILIVTPLIVIWAHTRWSLKGIRWIKFIEMAGLFLLCCITTWFIFDCWGDTINHIEFHPYLLTIFIIWSAIRFEPRGTVTLLSLLSMISILCTAAGIGTFPLGGVDANMRMLAVQMFLGVTGVMGLMLTASICQQKESQKEYQRLIDDNHDIIYTLSADGVFTFVSSVWTKLLGHSTSHVKGQSFKKFVHADDIPMCLVWLNKIVETGQRQEGIEYRVQHANGSWYWYTSSAVPLKNESGTVTGFTGIARDITKRKRAEDELREREKNYRTLIETTRTGFLVLDGQGRVMDANAEYVRLSGRRELGEILGRCVIEWTAEHSREKNTVAVTRCIRDRIIQGLEIDYTDLDGRITPIEINATAEGTGADLRILALCRDITERKQGEVELQKIDKLQSVGTLAAGIAHDFNNILQSLYGNISFAKEDIPKGHPSYAFIEKAEKSMNRAVRLTKQLLIFAKGGAPIKETFDLKTMVEETVHFDLSGSNVNLVYHHADDLWQVDADKGQIQQVFSNLVINAREAMPNGGNLYITLQNADLATDAIPTVNPGRYVKIVVKDEGAGIDPARISKIFDPYFTTKHTGSGLGLATVWSIITKHGGYVRVVSELGKGAKFTFYLPATTSVLHIETKSSTVKCPISDRPTKILVMDDEEAICELITQMLARFGCTVATAYGGQKTVALYKQALEAGAPFDLVILDMTIPGEPGGKEVINDLHALDPNVRAIVSSGYADNSVIANPTAYGFKGAIVKPFISNGLREIVGKLRGQP